MSNRNPCVFSLCKLHSTVDYYMTKKKPQEPVWNCARSSSSTYRCPHLHLQGSSFQMAAALHTAPAGNRWWWSSPGNPRKEDTNMHSGYDKSCKHALTCTQHDWYLVSTSLVQSVLFLGSTSKKKRVYESASMSKEKQCAYYTATSSICSIYCRHFRS